MSLNDRFTVLRQEKPSGQQGQGAPGIEERRQQTQASRRNQRLAAQMERRPTVVAALKLKKRPQQKTETFIQKHVDQRTHQRPLNVKQRLAVKGRLSLPNENLKRTANFRGRGGIRGLRGSTGNFRGISTRGIGFRGGRGFLSNKGGGNMPRGARGGIRSGIGGGRGGRFMRGMGGGRGGRFVSGLGGGRGGMQGRGGARGGLRGSGMSRGQGQGALRRTRGRGRGGRMNRGGRGSRGASNIQNGGNFTREQLDQQLDDYMNKTKDTMDGDLDHYMDEV